ncbi:MmcQ/YjbR family DNA-binding protein [Stackebrandtia nassauensis]|uniref:MmcQ-like protein n=1 Tax=Stackebrandtia nassauensis (strain DSM 44728 / CIP 108903 / NRRL B-16338 / NBRC 102104 / LLR-40K-21) TaxID=446470 RepID=D3PXH8_STANL|nr:MmcQ/YjbR family DNA-binding protein [Stackebrandtia nassauensis]ADD41441.1 protein of unknown function DUF419 [Stackebrandtia nassauensis DSM 44728]
MTPDELRELLLSFTASVEGRPFTRHPEITTFKVSGKVFALARLDDKPMTVMLKCDPEEAIRLRQEHDAIVGGFNKRHWNYVTIDGSLPDDLIEELITDSYDLVVAGLPKSKRPPG